jgi:hypothetical protein
MNHVGLFGFQQMQQVAVAVPGPDGTQCEAEPLDGRIFVDLAIVTVILHHLMSCVNQKLSFSFDYFVLTTIELIAVVDK